MLGLPRPVLTLDVSDTTTSYVRSDVERGEVGVDLDTLPALAVGLDFRRAAVHLAYSPRLTVRDVGDEADRTFQVVHNAYLDLTYRTPRTRVDLGHSLLTGRQLYSNVAQLPTPGAEITPPTTARVDLLPGVRSLRVLSSQSYGSISHRFTPRWSSDLRGGYGISGGRDAAAQEIQPRLKEGRVAAALGYLVTRRDQVSLELSTTRMVLSNGYEHWISGASAGWNHSFRRTTQASLDAGALMQRTTLPSDETRTKARPSVSASVSQEASRGFFHTTLSAGAALGPRVNTLTGELLLVAQGQATASLRHDLTTVALTVDAFQSLPTDEPLAARVIGGTLLGLQTLNEWLDIAASARLQDQRLEGSTLSLPLQWAVGVGVRVHAPTQRH